MDNTEQAQPVKAEGVDYTPEGVAAVRAALTEMRGEAFKHWPQGAYDYTVVLTHAVALLSYLIELQRQLQPFQCSAVIWFGPGHQSSVGCERHVPHELSDEHYADDPMEPGFTWTGAEGFSRP